MTKPSSSTQFSSPQAPPAGAGGLRGGGPGAASPAGCSDSSKHPSFNEQRSTYPFGLRHFGPDRRCRIRAAAHVEERPCCREQPRLRPIYCQPATLGSATVEAVASVASLIRSPVLTGIKRNTSSRFNIVHASSNIRRATAMIAFCLQRRAAIRLKIDEYCGTRLAPPHAASVRAPRRWPEPRRVIPPL